MTPDSDVIILCRRIMASESGVIICLHSIKTSADLLKRKRFTHGTLCSKSRSNEASGEADSKIFWRNPGVSCACRSRILKFSGRK